MHEKTFPNTERPRKQAPGPSKSKNFFGLWIDSFMEAFHDAFKANFRDQICGKKFITDNVFCRSHNF